MAGISCALARTAILLAGVAAFNFAGSSAKAQSTSLPREVPPGTKLVVADQNQQLQVLLRASGQLEKRRAAITFANFIGGPAILEAFRAGALDLAVVGNTPPIQAHASGERIPIVAARVSSGADYNFALLPSAAIASLDDFKGKRIAYAEGTGRQPFVLNALKLAGLTKKDVKLINLRAADFPDAIRAGQVDIAALNEPHFSRYAAEFASVPKAVLPHAVSDKLPRGLSYLYASRKALGDPAKTAAIADVVRGWIAATSWASANPEAWIEAYYVKAQKLKAEDGRAVVLADGVFEFPRLKSIVSTQQELIDLIHGAGDIPRRLDAAEEFDFRFDELIAEVRG